ncbi:MAG: hypothetical protein U5L45_11705 [Saprospiraceae bacterium]|nr:hypothetical protein [Saprospiraceae bacterium]
MPEPGHASARRVKYWVSKTLLQLASRLKKRHDQPTETSAT